MKIIEPSVEYRKQGDNVKAHVAKCARVCYGKVSGNDDVTINTLLKKHHWSMFRHESVYVIGEFTSRLSIALYTEAFSKRATDRYSFDTKEWTKNKNPICWYGGLFEHKDNVLTGKYFNICYLQQRDIINGWTPKPTRNIDCVEIEIAPDNWIMAIDTNDIDLIYLSLDYDIQWENCFCMKDIRLEDVTPELEKRAFEEIENNK